MQCGIFKQSDLRACGNDAHRLVAVGLGTSRVSVDVILFGYVPVCPHHAEYVPIKVPLLTLEQAGYAESVSE